MTCCNHPFIFSISSGFDIPVYGSILSPGTGVTRFNHFEGALLTAHIGQ